MINEIELINVFQSCCKHYFKTKFQSNKFLYFDSIPHSYFGKEYTVAITSIEYDWLDRPDLSYGIHTYNDRDYGRNNCKFKQTCRINYFFIINSLLISSRQIKTIDFYAETLEPFGENISPSILVDDLIAMDNIRQIKLQMKKKFEIENIDEVKYINDSIGFAFFADVLRKERKTILNNPELANWNFYSEISNCHKEIEECLLSGLFHQKYSSDILGRKTTFNEQDYYLPNLGYNDLQYLLMIGFGLDRLYSFWDRITFLLASYDSIGLDMDNISFFKYFKNIQKKLSTGSKLLFNMQSENLNWLINFHNNEFPKITEYRHRIVHYQVTTNSEGVLSSKFVNNTQEFGNSIIEMQKVKLEFEGLGFMLHKNFNLCKEGFVKTLNLIDELN